MSGDTLLRRGLWLAISLLVLLAYWGGLDAPFVYDDKVEVVGNRTIRFLDNWRAIVAYNVSRPLLIATYALDLNSSGFEPRGYHLTSLAIHVLSVGAALFLAEGVLRRLEHPKPLLVASLVAAVWAVHPMATESVTYITGRSESLCALFVFGGLGAWVRAIHLEDDGRVGIPWRVVGLLAFAGAVTTKEVGAMLPVAFVWTELCLGPRGRKGRATVRWGWFLPLALLIALAVWARYQHAGTLLHREVERPFAVQLLTMTEVWLHYLRLWLLPVGQTLFHHQPDLEPGSMRSFASLGGWAAMVGLGVWASRGRPVVAWALGCAALFLLPSSSVVPLKENMAEHRAYQQGFYLCIALGAAVPAAAWAWARWLGLVLLIPLVLLTQARNTVWSDEVALWTEASKASPEVADAWYGLGDARRFSGDFEAAATAYQKAVDRAPENLEAWSNLGIARAEIGDAEGAREAWEAALRVRPSYCKAHNNLGSLAYRRQEWDRSITELRSTLAYCPDSVVAHYLLGRIYDGPRPDRERAVGHYQRVDELDPQFDRIEFVRERLMALTF